MLVPVCSTRLPVKLQISVVSARGLPIMNKNISNTDAFVEIRFLDEVEKTDIITDLDPVWNSEYFEFETDEKELAKEVVEFRVMDHDTYTTNDAIGRVELDCNILIESMRQSGEDRLEQHLVLPIWDTLCGVRGHLAVGVKIALMIPFHIENYVQFLSSDSLPKVNQMIAIIGLVGTLRLETDPEMQWIDRIRTPRATNETRQSAMRNEVREAAIDIADKAVRAGANMILGYCEHIDIEGAPTNNYCVRAYGTAVKVTTMDGLKEELSGHVDFPIVTLKSLPLEWTWGIGPLVSARSVSLLEDVENQEAIKRRAWTSLRHEIFNQAAAMGCNIVMGYSEEKSISDGIAILTCTGTAVKYGAMEPFAEPQQHVKPHNEDPKQPCSPYHSSIDVDKFPFAMKLYPCNYCKKELCSDLIISTGAIPPPALTTGPRNYVQVSIARKITPDEGSEDEELPVTISKLLPMLDRDMFNLLISEGKTVNAQGNGFFEVRQTVCISEGMIVAAMTAVLVRLNCLHKDESSGPALPPVLSFASLQQHNDARRFSWGTVREAIRGSKQQALPASITLKILHLKRSKLEASEDDQDKRSRLVKIVDKIKRKPQKEPDYMSHCILERQLSANVGIVEAGTAMNTANVAGIHMGAPLISLVFNREQAAGTAHVARWRQIYIKEDTTGAVRDSLSTDAFLSSAFEECLSLARGALSSCSAAAFAYFSIPSVHISSSKDQAQVLALLSSDFVMNSS